MKKLILLLFLLGLSSQLFTEILHAGDTITVQTFTFNDIYKRRDKFVMPPKSESFSKILMLYTLKCDPKTPHDKYNCGEWDYLTYNMIYTPTGRMDSTKTTKMQYSFGYSTPDTLYYANSIKDFLKVQNYYKTTITNVSDEQTFMLADNAVQGAIQGKYAHLQFTLTSKQLRDSGMKSGNFQKISFYSNTVGAKLKNLIIKLRSSSSTTSSSFENYNFKTVYNGDYEITKAGLQEIAFITPFSWNQFQNLNFDISFEQNPATPIYFGVGTASNSIYSSKEETYLDFRGPNDYIDCGNIKELNNASQLTFEAWVNIREWSKWSAIINKNDKIFLGTGDQLGQIYCIMRNPGNSYGYANNAVLLDEWNHIAMVFDGTKTENADRMKLYINGSPITLTFSGQIPDKSPANNAPFTISSNLSGSASITASMDEIRVWNTALSGETIAAFKDIDLTAIHPNYSNLLGYYKFDEKDEHYAMDSSPKKNNGRMIGIPKWKDVDPENLYMGLEQLDYIPYLTLSRGTYTIKVDTLEKINIIDIEPISIVKYKIENNAPVIDSIFYKYPTGWFYSYNADGSKSDSSYIPSAGYYVNSTLSYYSEPFVVNDEIEIGRFITPYGINLDLGPEGFTWTYDITDYEPYLHDTIDFAAGNLQELIDVKFLFIKGTPPRKVNKIHKVWGNMRSISYKNLSDDSQLSKITLDLLPESKSFKMKTRLTGHGHNSNDGNYPHCCEWKDNTHYLYSNSDLIASWHVWQENDCALNPVFPQGGTWPGSREGWCPGDVVKDNDFEVTNYVKNNQITLDYDITKVPSDNLGMGNGNYVTAMQLFEYGENTFDLDAEIYDVIMPSSKDYYSRTNPICSDPIIVIRNNGISTLTSLNFEYFVKGGTKANYKWTGSIPTMQSAKVLLPVPASDFWIGDGSNKFVVNISNPNGIKDLNNANDTFTSDFFMPDLHKYSTKIQLKTNLRGQNFSYKLTNVQGQVIQQKSVLSANTLYEIPLNLTQGCYTFEVTDVYNYGLSYWAYPDQGSGYLKVVDGNGNNLKVFNPDFGHGITYSFFVGSYSLVQEPNLDNMVYLFPNPTENLLNIALNEISGEINITILDINGKRISNSEYNLGTNQTVSISTEGITAGTYLVIIDNGMYKISKKFIKK